MEDWISLNKNSGSGYDMISVTAIENSGSPRTTNMTVSAHTVTANVSVEQEGSPLFITPSACTFDCTGGTQEFTINSNADWEITSYPSWLQLSSLSGTSGTSTVTATASVNTGDFRFGYVVANSSGSSASLDAGQKTDISNVTYLRFIMQSDGTIRFVNVVLLVGKPRKIYYRINGGDWHSLVSDSNNSQNNTISVVSGDIIEFFGNNNTYSDTPTDYSCFLVDGQFSICGNIMSLVNYDFQNLTGLTGTFNFNSMFEDNTGLTSSSGLTLPPTTLTNGCYRGMFAGCRSMVDTPVLPATTLAEDCYAGMFEVCSSLTTGPLLPARLMKNSCYRLMFEGCTSLVQAPDLPATALDEYCYSGMFWGCTSLTVAPELPATVLKYNCYEQMFDTCTSLNYVKCLARNVGEGIDFCYSWLYDVSPNGTFVRYPGETWYRWESGIPEGWTVQDA